MVKFLDWSQGRNIRRLMRSDGPLIWVQYSDRSQSSEFAYVRSRQAFWGALAYGPNGAHGRSWYKTSREDAEASALKDCARLGKCHVISFGGDTCAALSSHQDKVNPVDKIADSTNSYAARVFARRRCQAEARGAPCRIVAMACADGRHQLLRSR